MRKFMRVCMGRFYIINKNCSDFCTYIRPNTILQNHIILLCYLQALMKNPPWAYYMFFT